MFNYTLRPLSRKCEHSGDSFEPGESVCCIILKSPKGSLSRIDVKQDALEQFSPDGEIVAKWNRKMREKDTSDDDAPQESPQQSAEEIFDGMCQDASDLPEKATLLEALALYLERKKILKRIGINDSGEILYRHAQSKCEYSVKPNPLAIEAVGAIYQTLPELIGE